MTSAQSIPRYNHRIPEMRARTSSGPRIGRLTSCVLFMVILGSRCHASSLSDAAHELAHKIAVDAGPGTISLGITNRSSLDDKSVREVRSALETQLHVEGVTVTKLDQAMGSVTVVLSESLREYVWTAEIAIGPDETKVSLVSLPRSQTAATFSPALPVVLKTTLLFAQSRAIYDLAVVDIPGGSRLLVLNDDSVAIYRRQGLDSAPRWDLEATLPIAHSSVFPRDLRGRLGLRRDHLFDVYFPGIFCRSSSTTTLTISCTESDYPWPLTPEETSIAVRAFFSPARNFFTGGLSPGIGKLSTVPPFYSAAPIPRLSYTLWMFAGIDGSIHFVDGMTDQTVPSTKITIGSDLATVRSNCGQGIQVLADSTDSDRDSLRAFEVPDRDPVPVSTAAEFNGRITALWPENSGNTAVAIVKRQNAAFYESYRISITCNN